MFRTQFTPHHLQLLPSVGTSVRVRSSDFKGQSSGSLCFLKSLQDCPTPEAKQEGMPRHPALTSCLPPKPLPLNLSPCITMFKLQSSVLSLPFPSRAFLKGSTYLWKHSTYFTRHAHHATFYHLLSMQRTKNYKYVSVRGKSSLIQPKKYSLTFSPLPQIPVNEPSRPYGEKQGS